MNKENIDTTIKDRTDALGFFKLMRIKNVTTSRQKKNGTTVYELPVSRLSHRGNAYKYKYAIYDSGYIRDVSKWNSSPWYINKRYLTKTKYWNSYHKEYGEYVGNKPVFIDNFDDQLVYLANYILKNRYINNELYNCCDWNIEKMKEQHKFVIDVRHGENTITMTREDYNNLQRAKSVATDRVEVIINGTRYNLS